MSRVVAADIQNLAAAAEETDDFVAVLHSHWPPWLSTHCFTPDTLTLAPYAFTRLLPLPAQG
jgi:hypothetical protein